MLAQKNVATTPVATSKVFPEVAKPITKQQHYWNLFSYYFMLVWRNSIIILLALQSVDGLYKAIKFIIDDYPMLEAQIRLHALDPHQMAEVLKEAVGLMLGTIINILFAIRLSRAQEKVSQVLELIFGTALIIWYPQVLAFLQLIDYTLIGESFSKLFP